MQTSILWEGSLPSKEEMEKMKQEGLKCYNKVVTEVANKI